MASRSSSVWQYFVVSSVNESRVTCNLCKTSLARGGKASKHGFGTSNLRKHLQGKHNDEFLALVASETTVKTLPSNSASSSSSQSTVSSSGTFSENVHQTTLTKAFDAKRPWDFDDQRARRIHRLIGEMIAVDDQPFNIVNNQGTLTTCNEVRLLQRRILMSRSVELTR